MYQIHKFEKAFDKVSRFKLLKKLVKLGIGNVMLQALKRLYTETYCILSHGKEYSEIFRTFTGIRQGASSSALLFITFIDDLVDYLKEHCQTEAILEDLHCLLHADDTVIISTERTLFVQKCDHMLDYFRENSLSLNLSKSGYLIINGNNDIKSNIMLKNGILEYKSVVTYLGVIISDKGNIEHDALLYLEEKRSNVTIRYGNFCRKNFLAPLDVKLHVLNSCMSTALIYGSETWGKCRMNKFEVIYRQGLKTALSIRSTVNNEIVYIESGEYPLFIRIAKQQINFWGSIQNLAQDHYISKLIHTAEESEFVRYYKDLEHHYNTPCEYERLMKNDFQDAIKEKLQTAAQQDVNSKLGTYSILNPNLLKPKYEYKLEFQRVMITRYRTGAHNLMIEKGRRQPRIPQEERLCSCNRGVQTIHHVIMDCLLLNELRNKYNVTCVENGIMNDQFLLEMEHILGIK